MCQATSTTEAELEQQRQMDQALFARLQRLEESGREESSDEGDKENDDLPSWYAREAEAAEQDDWALGDESLRALVGRYLSTA